MKRVLLCHLSFHQAYVRTSMFLMSFTFFMNHFQSCSTNMARKRIAACHGTRIGNSQTSASNYASHISSRHSPSQEFKKNSNWFKIIYITTWRGRLERDDFPHQKVHKLFLTLGTINVCEKFISTLEGFELNRNFITSRSLYHQT